ncbi:MAG: helix-turn-helix domain-containing protein [Hyphomonadaceae bacterium]
MALFFDAPWFDAKLAARGLTRADLASSAGLSREDLHRIVSNEREATGPELTAFAALLGADIVEISLKCGVSARVSAEDNQSRLDDLDARLDRIDRWLAQLEAGAPAEEEEGSPSLRRAGGGLR